MPNAILEAIKEVFNDILTVPILNVLVFFYTFLGQNLGLAIIALTIFTRVILIPLTLPSLKAAVKQKELAPELAALKKKYGDNKTLLAQKQMELYKQHGFNPASGCLPQILNFAVLIALYQVLLDIFRHSSPAYFNGELYPFIAKFAEGDILHTNFWYLDLAKKDPYYIIPVLAGITQFVLSKISMPVVSSMEKIAEKTPDNKDDVMYNMQKQTMYILPAMTVFIGISLPSGLVLYWLATTLFALMQQWIINKKQLKS